jgi:RHS repeat-associated protein
MMDERELKPGVVAVFIVMVILVGTRWTVGFGSAALSSAESDLNYAPTESSFAPAEASFEHAWRSWGDYYPKFSAFEVIPYSWLWGIVGYKNADFDLDSQNRLWYADIASEDGVVLFYRDWDQRDISGWASTVGTQDSGRYPCFALDDKDVARVAYTTFEDSGNDTITKTLVFQKFSLDNLWTDRNELEVIVQQEGVPGGLFPHSLQIDSSKNSHILYSFCTSDSGYVICQLRHIIIDDQGQVVAGPFLIEQVGDPSSPDYTLGSGALAIDEQDNVYALYAKTTESDGYAMYATLPRQGDSWGNWSAPQQVYSKEGISYSRLLVQNTLPLLIYATIGTGDFLVYDNGAWTVEQISTDADPLTGFDVNSAGTVYLTTGQYIYRRTAPGVVEGVQVPFIEFGNGAIYIDDNDQIHNWGGKDCLWNCGIAPPVYAYYQLREDNLGWQDHFVHQVLSDNSSANVANGNIYVNIPIFSSISKGLPTDLGLVYNSRSMEQSFAQSGWQSNYHVYVTRTEIRLGYSDYHLRYSLVLGDGRHILFDRADAYDKGGYQAYVAQEKYGNFSKLEELLADTHPYNPLEIRMIDKFGAEYQFDVNSGKLISVTNTNSNTLTLNYGDNPATPNVTEENLVSIVDSANRTTTFEYSADYHNALTEITGPDGKEYALHYNADWQLEEIVFPEVNAGTVSAKPTWTFLYHTDHTATNTTPGARKGLLAEIRNPERTAAGQPGTRFYYWPDNWIGEVMDPAGNSWNFDYTELDDGAKTRTDVTLRGRWDGQNFVRDTYSVETDFLKSVATKVTDPENDYIERAFDDYRNVLSFSDKRGNVTTYTYEDEADDYVKDRLATVKPPLVPTTTFTYVGGDNPKTVNLIQTVTDPKGHITAYGYDENGNVTSVVYNDGALESFDYNSDGTLDQFTDRRGSSTQYEYSGNILGLPSAILRAAPGSQPGAAPTVATTFTYDAMGNLRRVDTPEGTFTENSYDALYRVTARSDSGLETSFKYDLNSNLTLSTDPEGKKSHYGYDLLDRQIMAANHNWSGDPIDKVNAVNTAYDPNGNVTLVNDERNVDTTAYIYDSLNRTATITQLNAGYSDSSGPDVVTAYTYDPNGNVETITNGPTVTTLVYDELNRQVESHITGAGSSYTFYDDNSNVELSAQDTGTTYLTTKYEYDDMDRTRRVAEVTGFNPTSYSLNNLPALNEVNVMMYTYDEGGNRIASFNAADSNKMYGTLTTYDANNVPYRSEEVIVTPGRGPQQYNYVHAGAYSRTIYDDNYRVQEVWIDDPTDGTDDPGQFPTGFVLSVRNHYDAVGRLDYTEDVDGNRTYYVYDDVGNLVQSTDRNGNITDMAYDDLHRLVASTVYTASGEGDAPLTTQYRYDEASNQTRVTDPGGQVSDATYDVQGRVHRIYNHPGRPGGTCQEFSYDLRGNLYKRTDELGHYGLMTFDDANRLIGTAYFDASDTLLNTLERQYDAASNLVALREKSNLGLPQAGDMEIAYQYDGVNRLISEARLLYDGAAYAPWKAVQYSYYGDGNLERMTHPDGDQLSTRHQYDALGRLVEVGAGSTAQPQATTYTFDVAGRLTQLVHANGVTTTYTYDTHERLTAIQALPPAPGPDLAHISYAYDNENNRTDITWHHLNTSAHYDYNGVYWLTGEQISGDGSTTFDLTQAWAYDRGGNRTRQTVVNAAPNAANSGATTYNYGSENRLLSSVFQPESGPAVNINYTYDSEGKLISKETSSDGSDTLWESFNYNYQDRMSEYLAQTGTMTTAHWQYEFTPDGQRRSKSNLLSVSGAANLLGASESDLSEYYMYAGSDVIADYDANMALQAGYVNGPGIDSKLIKIVYGLGDDEHQVYLPIVLRSGATGLFTTGTGGAALPFPLAVENTNYYYLHDGLGSVHMLLGEQGQVVNTSLSDAWGNAVYQDGDVADRYGFTGRELDAESELMYYRARMYDPEVGRFLAKDPSGMPDGPNQYIYVVNNPANGTDPRGLLTLLVHGTYATDAEWVKSNSDYARALEQAGINDIQKNAKGNDIEVFQWSGNNTKAARTAAAKELAEFINKLRRENPDEKINVVAHSHGGNVATGATQKAKIDNLVLLGTPFMSSMSASPGSAYKICALYEPNLDNVNSIAVFFSFADPVQTWWASQVGWIGESSQSARIFSGQDMSIGGEGNTFTRIPLWKYNGKVSIHDVFTWDVDEHEIQIPYSIADASHHSVLYDAKYTRDHASALLGNPFGYTGDTAELFRKELIKHIIRVRKETIKSGKFLGNYVQGADWFKYGFPTSTTLGDEAPE